ncbi:MAG: clostripain-related cysteine peptidase [Thermoplasmata archaeon]|nr:clostripain-related cysteine peptidase [Thermoplasmata archaeon]
MAVLIVVPVMLVAAPAHADTVADSWTVMVYMDGDNNVESYALRDLEELKLTGSSDNVNYVVLLDTLEGPANLLYVNEGTTTIVEAWGEVAMDDPATLTEFIDTVEGLYPATNYCLDIWDHGGGIAGICWDDTSGMSQCLTMAELRTALVDADCVFDSIVLNACVMAQAEVAHQVNGYADYVVFSQQNMYALGWPYDVVAENLNAEPTMDGRALSLMMVEEYTVYYQSIGYKDVTISVFDMAHLEGLANAVKDFVSAQIAVMDTYQKGFKFARMDTESASNAADITGYAENVIASEKILDQNVKDAAQAVIFAVDAAIIAEWHSIDVEGMNGLGIWFPTKSVTYYWGATYEVRYRALTWDAATGWANFLDAYYNKG